VLMSQGFSREVATSLLQNRDMLTLQGINEMIAACAAAKATSPEFPVGVVPNRERRAAGVQSRARRADLKTYDERKRSVRTSAPQLPPKIWLREMYTNSEGVTVCQVCRKAMPFRMPATNEYYFEAIQIADSFAKEDHCLYLALCPLCAAKYCVLVKKDRNYLNKFIRSLEEAAAGDFIIPIQLGEETASLRFVESHLLDLKTALPECMS